MTRAQMERLRERAERARERRERLERSQTRYVAPRLDWRTVALLASGDAKGAE